MYSMIVCVAKTQRQPCINPSLANRKLSSRSESGSFMFSHCVHSYVWVTTAIQIRSLYAAVQSTTFNYVCEWIWWKVNCSVKLGNGLFDVWALITWHFYYSTRKEERRDEEEEKQGKGILHSSAHQRDSVYGITGFQVAWWEGSYCRPQVRV